MGGTHDNRPPKEGISTDHKTRPGDERIMQEDVQKYESTKDHGESKHIPESKLNPALQQVKDKNDVRGQ